MEIVKEKQPPTGLSRLLFRLPIHLYRTGLGGLLSERVMLLHHVGRITGKQRQAVLEVLTHDRHNGSYLVASGWGTSAAWYRNVLHTPDVTIQVGKHTIPVTAAPLATQEAVEIVSQYYWEHRRVAKQLLPRLYGYAVDGSMNDFREVARQVPVIRFTKRTPSRTV